MPGRPRTFRSARQGSVEQARKAYDVHRGSARERGYDAAWDREAAIERRLRPLCLGCEAIGLTVPTEVIDHVIPHKGDMVLFWDPANRQPACNWHHVAVKQRLEHLWAAGKIGDADLRLDSPAAIALTRQLSPG